MEDKHMTTNKKKDLVEVFSGRRFEVEVVKGLLESNNLPCVLTDKSMAPITATYGNIAGDTLLLVAPENEERARNIISESRK